MAWQREAVGDAVEGEPLEVRKEGGVRGVWVGDWTEALDLDDAVGDSNARVGEVIREQLLDNQRRDGVGEGVGLFEVHEALDNHRVDVREELEDGPWLKAKCAGVHLEGECYLEAGLGDKGERLDGLDVIDEEEDVGEVGGLKADGHEWDWKLVFEG